jgi:sec-independent protein translocase protein TatA
VLTNLLTPTHIAILLAVLLLIVGPKRLPQTGRALGSGIREFKDAIRGNEHPTGDTPTQGLDESRLPTTRPSGTETPYRVEADGL